MLIHPRTKDGLFQAQTSRYLSEFEEIAKLGKGSYGKVFKVRRYFDHIVLQIQESHNIERGILKTVIMF